MKGELGKGLGSYYRGRNLDGQESKDRQAWKGRGGSYYRDRRQTYGQRSHDRVDLIGRIMT